MDFMLRNITRGGVVDDYTSPVPALSRIEASYLLQIHQTWKLEDERSKGYHRALQ